MGNAEFRRPSRSRSRNRATYFQAAGKRCCPPTSSRHLLSRLTPHAPFSRPEIEAMRGRKRSTRRFAEPLSLRKTLRTFSTIPQFLQTRSPAMNFIGVDLHKKSITICVMDEKRKILARKTVSCTQTDEILEFFRQFRPLQGGRRGHRQLRLVRGARGALG